MFHRYHNLKRAVGLLGVVLALSSAAQQARLCCFVAGCFATRTCDDREQLSSCPHACHECEVTSASASHDGCQDEPEGTCPEPCSCPLADWCQQSPEPIEIPRKASLVVGLKLIFPADADGTLVRISHREQLARTARLAALDSSTASAAQLCSRLCRFLI
jgi:hypothetical protein